MDNILIRFKNNNTLQLHRILIKYNNKPIDICINDITQTYKQQFHLGGNILIYADVNVCI